MPLKNIKAETVARAFLKNWISRYGVPHRFTTDRGAQFTSALFKQLGLLLSAKHIRTTSYHPQVDAQIERFQRHFKSALMCFDKNWVQYLPSVLLGIRATSFDDSGVS